MCTRFSVLDSMSPGGVWRHVAVPSRLYFQKSQEKPLNGLRIAIKDNFHVSCIQTTMSSRAYMEIYGPDLESANYVKLLPKLGGIIVGKSKSSPFVSFNELTDQWIDFISPTNPRGDRYQSPTISSSGSAAALAGYEWLDFSIGTNSKFRRYYKGDFQLIVTPIGSVRAPAAANGLFSLRPSHNSTSLEGLQPGCE